MILQRLLIFVNARHACDYVTLISFDTLLEDLASICTDMGITDSALTVLPQLLESAGEQPNLSISTRRATTTNKSMSAKSS
jgi:hypothetical protein